MYAFYDRSICFIRRVLLIFSFPLFFLSSFLFDVFLRIFFVRRWQVASYLWLLIFSIFSCYRLFEN